MTTMRALAALAVVGLAAGAAGCTSDATTDASGGAAEAPAEAPADAPAEAPAEEAPAPTGTSLPGDGTFVVGSEMKPGLWKGIDASGGYWARLKNASGELDSIIANDNVGSGSTYVQIASGDKYFEANGFGEWVKMPAKPTGPRARTFPGEGMYMVGVDIAPGTYRAKSDGSGYWARLKNASGELGGIIANDNVLTPTATIVEISSGDAFFETNGFGQWTKAG